MVYSAVNFRDLVSSQFGGYIQKQFKDFLLLLVLLVLLSICSRDELLVHFKYINKYNSSIFRRVWLLQVNETFLL